MPEETKKEGEVAGEDRKEGEVARNDEVVDIGESLYGGLKSNLLQIDEAFIAGFTFIGASFTFFTLTSSSCSLLLDPPSLWLLYVQRREIESEEERDIWVFV